MPTKQLISNSKIILLVVFVCSAIMTSLFVYHATHKPTLTILANGNATLFPVARDIKPFTLQATTNEKFTQQHLYHHWTLMFFGFTHCDNICPTTLDMLSKAYGELHTAYPDLQVVLVSLDPARDHLATLSKYTHTFNPNFIGLTGNIQDIRKLQSQLGIFSAQDDTGNQQIQHSSSILLINPQGKWAGIFKFGMNPKEFVAAFTESMQHYA